MLKGLPFDAVVVSDDFESKIDSFIETYAEALRDLPKGEWTCLARVRISFADSTKNDRAFWWFAWYP